MSMSLGFSAVRVSDNVMMTPLTVQDVQRVHEAVVEAQGHLAPWMPWAQNPEPALEAARDAERRLKAGHPTEWLLEAGDRSGRVLGRLGFHGDGPMPGGTCSLGYWITPAAQGRGLVTWAVETMVSYALDTVGAHRIEIKANVENIRSRAIPERLGFTLEGVMRGAETIAGQHRDLALYALLATDPRPPVSEPTHPAVQSQSA